jgi:8-oxo-dGTP diphosphatase
MKEEIANLFGNRVRVRACGLCWDAGKLLLVNHKGLQHSNFWAPPGGGVEFGETMEGALKREFLEETGLEISVTRFAFGCEFIKDPLHAIELFFLVRKVSGTLISGYDPELQLIQGARFMTDKEIQEISDLEQHGILRFGSSENTLSQLSGFYSI